LAIEMCASGYHVYNNTWVTDVVEELPWEYEAIDTKNML